MATSNCVFNSINLSPGESFVLPPGATVLSVTDIAAIDSECLDLSSIEQLGCYVALIGSWHGDNIQGEDAYWENDRMRVIGYELNGVRTLFSDPDTGYVSSDRGCFNGQIIAEELKALIPAISAVAGASKSEAGPIGQVGSCLTYILVQTIPSIATNLKLVTRSTGPISGGNEIVINTTSFIPYDTLVSSGYIGLPTSPCVALT